LAVYYTVGNLHASVRSKIDCVLLALLCNHTSLVTGPGIAEVLKLLISDLVSLQNDSVNLERYGIRNGKVVSVLADNLYISE
jgi:hypothetical protein